MRNTVLVGDCLAVLKTLPSDSVHCCVTSPPYWGLRNYGVEPSIWGGDPMCGHDFGILVPAQKQSGGTQNSTLGIKSSGPTMSPAKQVETIEHQSHDGQSSAFCTKCDAWRGCLGLEPTPKLYIEHLVSIFQEVRRVLRGDGTLWLNLGDSFAATHQGRHGDQHSDVFHSTGAAYRENVAVRRKRAIPEGIKPKDLIGIPWMAAFALRDDGWWLRAENIWEKGNVMPESVTDRTTRSHEHVFLFAKSPRYFYDADAIREPFEGEIASDDALSGRNKRTVWHINPRPYKGAHFATFPPELPELCIKAGTSEKGACVTCGAPWRRIVIRKGDVPMTDRRRHLADAATDGTRLTQGGGTARSTLGAGIGGDVPGRHSVTVGWEPTCACTASKLLPCMVLDPFSGSGTTLAVAKGLRRDYVGIELNPEYAKLIEERVQPAEEHEKQRSAFDFAMGLPED